MGWNCIRKTLSARRFIILTFTSCQSENAEPSCRAIAAWVAKKTGLPISYVDDIDWRERYRRLEEGQIDVGWICGGPYVMRLDWGINLELLVAPIFKKARYAGQPVYYSDIVVRAESPFYSIDDLAGGSWAINEPDSVSGCTAMAAFLARRGLKWDYFGRVEESGGHHISLEQILDGSIDASAIDSTMLETELAQRPNLKHQIRIIQSLGPNLQPPWVIGGDVHPEIKQTIQQAMLSMHTDSTGYTILHQAGIQQFTAMQDQDYEPIREMLLISQQAGQLF